jgi:hypothetical protein
VRFLEQEPGNPNAPPSMVIHSTLGTAPTGVSVIKS